MPPLVFRIAPRLALLFCVLIGYAELANAQYSVPSQASSKEIAATSFSRNEDTQMVIPDEEKQIPWELGASFNFITSEPSLGTEKLKFTDIVLLRLHALVRLGNYELFAGADVLPKQPSYTDELVWQGSLAGVRTSFGKDWSAWARVSGGPHLGRSGYWLAGDAAVEHHFALQKMLFVDTSLGWSHTQLLFDDTNTQFYTDEVFSRLGLSLRDPRKGLFAAWFNIDYLYPVLSNPGTLDTSLGLALDPQPRVNMRLGALGAVSKTVDLFVEYSILDRGDLENSTTTLPILGGGFDQRTLILGFMRHFGQNRRFY